MLTLANKPGGNEEIPDEDEVSGIDPVEDDLEEDGTPVLDEEDLEENNLSVEEADQIEWDEPK